MGYSIKQGQTAQPLVFLMIDSADHLTGKTGLTPTVTLSKNGGGFAAPAGLVTEIGNGWYKVAGNAVDSGTLGPLVLHATATGADPVDDRFDVVAFDPQSATNLGLSFLSGDAYAIVADPTFGNAQLVRSKVPANALSVGADNTSYVNVLKWLSATPPTPTTPGVPTVALAVTPPTAAQVRAEMDANSVKLDVAVSTRSTYAGGPVSGVTGNIVGNLQGNVTGSVGSVTGAVTVGTNNDKTGYALASTGLDAVSAAEPSAVPSTFRDMLVWLFMRFGGNADRSPNAIVVKKAGGATLTTQAISDDGAGNETQGAVA